MPWQQHSSWATPDDWCKGSSRKGKLTIGSIKDSHTLCHFPDLMLGSPDEGAHLTVPDPKSVLPNGFGTQAPSTWELASLQMLLDRGSNLAATGGCPVCLAGLCPFLTCLKYRKTPLGQQAPRWPCRAIMLEQHTVRCPALQPAFLTHKATSLWWTCA